MQRLLIPGSIHFYLSASFYQVDRPKATVQIIHGASEHTGRYDVVVEDQHLIPRFLQTACGDMPIVLLAPSFGANIAHLSLGRHVGDTLAVVIRGAPC